MNVLQDCQLSDFSVQFPETEQMAVLSLKLICEQLEIAAEPNDKRTVFELDLPGFPVKSANKVSEKDLKTWINNLGESKVFEEEEQAENWEMLLLSEAPENIVLALTLLNKPLRPESKYFSLWVALGSLHVEETVRETAKMLALQYLTEEEWNLFEESKIKQTITHYIRQEKEIPDFIDINYLQIWSELLLKNSPFFSQKWLRLTNKGLADVLEHSTLLKILPEITQFDYRIEETDSPIFLDYFHQNCPSIKYLRISSDAPRNFTPEEFACINRENIIVKNVFYPAINAKMSPLSNVRKLEWIYPEKVNFSDIFFPKITTLDVLGTSIENFNIERVKLNLKNLIFSFSNQNTLPQSTYECTNLTELHPHDLVNFEFPPEVKNLRKLETICFEGSTLKRFPLEIGLSTKLRYASQVDLTEIINFQDHKFKGPMDITLMRKEMKEFPYYLSVVQKLKTLGLMFNEIASIDERILKFTKLESLTLGQNKFTKIPDILMRLPKLRYLYFSDNQLKEISFNWFLFANQRQLQLNIQNNPITDLPPIPKTINPEEITRNKGKVTLRKGQIPQKRIAEYTSVFGGKFFSIY
ncbi:MAG: Leucine-rich repeat (LRR) protein [Paraglaciecola sp.]|jgi:Leucine-rich repeat (LRR) protein